MNKNWHKSYQQTKADKEDVKDRRNCIYSGLIVLGLYGIACSLGYIASCNKIKPYDVQHRDNDFTNRLERIER